jgi:flagellar motor protein MotB
MRKKFMDDDAVHHDRWLVSYADLMTLLFSFFVVMYASLSADGSKYKQLSESVALAFNLGKITESTTQGQNKAKDDSSLQRQSQAVAKEQQEAAETATKEALSADSEHQAKAQEHQNALMRTIDRLTGANESTQLALSLSRQRTNELEHMNDTMSQRISKLDELNEMLSSANRDRTALLDHIQKTLFDRGIQVEVDIKNGILRLPETLLFDSGRADFRVGGAAALKLVAQNLLAILPCYAAVDSSTESKIAACGPSSDKRRPLEAIFIEGHTDNVPITTAAFKDNWDLSIARAKNTYLELIKAAPVLETLTNEKSQQLLSFSAYSGRRPIASNEDANDRRKNRRIDLRFIMAAPESMSTFTYSLVRPN